MRFGKTIIILFTVLLTGFILFGGMLESEQEGKQDKAELLVQVRCDENAENIYIWDSEELVHMPNSEF